MSVACNLALKEMGNTNLTGYREGDRWDQWVRQLTKIAQESKIPFAASKGSDKATTYSAFTQESLIGGWYELVVVGRTADKLTLRSRDYPGYPKFTVPVLTVALLNPTAS